MHRVIVLEKAEDFTGKHGTELRDKGYEIFRTRSIREACLQLKKDNISLIVATDEFDLKIKDFIRFQGLSKDVPKLIITEKKSLSKIKPWLKDDLAYPIFRPVSLKEFSYLYERLNAEGVVINENKRLKDEFLITKKQLEFFEEVSRTLTSALELDDVMTTIMEKTKDMTRAEAWSIMLLDEDTGELVFKRIRGEKAKKIQRFRLKLGEGIAGWVAKEGVPVVIPDVSKDPRFYEKIDRAIHFKTKSMMCVPIKSKGRVLGVLEVVNKATGEPFTQADLDLLLRLVDHAAIAVERASLYQKMAEMAITDDLTKLFNLRYLNRTIDTEIERSNRYGSSVSVIFMDLDYFKNVNDQYGHLVGSKLLVEVAQLLLRNLRTIDIVARYGGDEFVVVLPQTNPRAAFMIAERIRRSMLRNVFLKNEGYSLRLTASFGIASYPESAKTREELIRFSDEAMYKVKNTTRDGVYAILPQK